MPSPQPPALASPAPTPPALLVACLCAEWCGTCREYKPLFAQLAQEFPGTQFLWVDIEDQADLVDPVEVDDFPTLLLATHGQPVFFGMVTPHVDTLRRLVQNHALPVPDGRPLAQAPALQALVQRLAPHSQAVQG